MAYEILTVSELGGSNRVPEDRSHVPAPGLTEHARPRAMVRWSRLEGRSPRPPMCPPCLRGVAAFAAAAAATAAWTPRSGGCGLQVPAWGGAARPASGTPAPGYIAL
jgi:hypothetical protein